MLQCVVIYSEQSTGSHIEEEIYKGLVVFAPTTDLLRAALDLLKSPQARWDLERKAGQFMTADHFNTEVPFYSGDFLSQSASRLSSLALVAKALQTAAGLKRDSNSFVNIVSCYDNAI